MESEYKRGNVVYTTNEENPYLLGVRKIKEEKDCLKLSVLCDLNDRHGMLSEKLAEAENRLFILANSLSGDFPVHEAPAITETTSNSLDNYSLILDKTEYNLSLIFNTLVRLEYLL